MTYRLAASPIGMLYIACNANLWHHWSGGAPPARTANPGDTPFIVQWTTRNDAARIRDRWAVTKRKHNAENSMDEALILRFYECIENDYAKDIRDDLLGIANPTFLQVFERATEKYGKTTAAQRMETRTRLRNTKWNPSDGTTRLWRHLKDCATLAEFQGDPIAEQQIKDAALIILNKSQGYPIHYLMCKEQGDQSYTNLKNYFDRADENRNEMQTEAGELGYGMGADEFFDAQEDDAATKGFKESLTNLAAAVQANQKTHSQLQQALAAQAQQQWPQ